MRFRSSRSYPKYVRGSAYASKAPPVHGPSYGSSVTAGEVYYAWPIPAGGPSYSRYVRTDPQQYPFGDLYQVGYKGDKWISHVKITDQWHDKYGHRVVRVLRVK